MFADTCLFMDVLPAMCAERALAQAAEAAAVQLAWRLA
jgi:hypothetical protein